jgi:hypothetical protein
MTPVRPACEVKTRELPRPESHPLPWEWDEEDGMYVHESGACSIETFDELDDLALAQALKVAEDVVKLLVWASRERAIAALRSSGRPARTS